METFMGKEAEVAGDGMAADSRVLHCEPKAPAFFLPCDTAVNKTLKRKYTYWLHTLLCVQFIPLGDQGDNNSLPGTSRPLDWNDQSSPEQSAMARGRRWPMLHWERWAFISEYFPGPWSGMARAAQNRVWWRGVVEGLCSTGSDGHK